jgi:Na+-driven multidrug efflux pump
MIEWGVAAGVLAGVLVAALHAVLPGVFSPDDAVRSVTAGLLLVMAALMPVAGAVFVLDGLLIGAGDQRYLAVAMVVGAVAFVPAVLAVRALDAGVTGIWLAVGVLMASRLATLGWRWAGDAWAVTGARAGGARTH